MDDKKDSKSKFSLEMAESKVDMDEFDQMLKISQMHKDDEKNRRGKSAVLSNPHLFRLRQRLTLEHYSKLTDNTNNIIMANTVSFTIHTSKKQISLLRKVGIADLKLEMVAQNCCIILRVIEKGFFLTGWNSVVEDHKGDICGFSVFNYPSDELFNIGTVVIVKEPYFRMELSGDPYIRCDSPTDIMVLRRSHPLHYLSEEIPWSNDLAEDFDDFLTNDPVPNTAEEWKIRGNFLFKRSDFVSAREAYLLGLKMCTEKTATWKVLRLNLAAVFLELCYYESTILAAIEVLESFPGEKKALFRAGKAHYSLRQYNEAYDYFDKLCKLHPDDSNVKKELIKTTTRLEEQRGKISILSLLQQSQSDPLKKLECADFIGPLKIANVLGKGRGVVLTADVEKGALLIVSKAFSANLNPVKMVKKPHGDDLLDLERSFAAIVSEMMEMMMKNPKTYGPIIYDLSTGESPRKDVQMYCDPFNRMEPICDVEIIKAIGICNRFAIPYLNPDLNGYDLDDKNGKGLFILPSYINHSCVPNVYLICLNDVMLIYAMTKLKEGEEILISYVPVSTSYKERKKVLKRRGFTCQCKRCEKQI